MSGNEQDKNNKVPAEADNKKISEPRGDSATPGAPVVLPEAGASRALSTSEIANVPVNQAVSSDPIPAPHRTEIEEAVPAVGVVRVRTQDSTPLLPPSREEVLSDYEAEKRIRKMSRRSFLWGAAAVAGVWGGIKWLGTRRTDNGVQWPLRRVLEVNENLSQDLFSGARLAPQFPKERAQTPRPNGDYGVASDEEPDWKLHLVGLADMSSAQMPDASNSDTSDSDTSQPDKKSSPDNPKDKKSGASGDAGQASGGSGGDSDSSDQGDQGDTEADVPPDPDPAVLVTMAQIRAIHKIEIVTELKCIEGWSTIVHWAGVPLVELMKKYPPATKSGDPFNPQRLGDLPEYVSMETPDGQYYVGLDMASALHPQTLLCYEMNGKPLTPEHGAPLRLVIPVKYGIKNIKHIGKIKFTDERPKDYWAERGYDWYAGH